MIDMKFIISGKNIDVTEGLKDAIQDKIGKLEKYFKPETEVHVTLSVEKDRQKIEVTIPVKGNIIRSEQVSNDMYVSIDLVEEIIERQLKKYKNKLYYMEENRIKGIEKSARFFHIPIDNLIQKNMFGEKSPKPWSKINNYDDYFEYQRKHRAKNEVNPPIICEFEVFNKTVNL